MECRVDAQPAATFEWMLDGQVLELTSDVEITQTLPGVSTLVISNLDYKYGGSYECNVYHVTSAAGPIRSSPATLEVYGPPRLDNDDIRNTTVPVGYVTTLTCKVTSNPESYITWTFTSSSTSILSSPSPMTLTSSQLGVSIDSSSGELTLDNVSELSSGLYTCTWTNQYGEISATAQLTVQGLPQAPQFVDHPADVTVVEGEELHLNCSCTGNPLPTIEWTRQAGDGNAGDENIETLQTETYEINTEFVSRPFVRSNVSRSESGVYLCTIKNKEGEESASADVDVLFVPSFTIYPQPTALEEGDALKLTCAACGNPQASITWTLPDKTELMLHTQGGAEQTQTEDGNVVVSGSGDLTIDSVTMSHDGTFTCAANNSVGGTEVSVIVTISGAPYFLTSPTSQGAVEGDNVVLACVVSSSAPVVVTWYHRYLDSASMYATSIANTMLSIIASDGELNLAELDEVNFQDTVRYSLASDGTSMSIAGVQAEDAGFFLCQAANIHGSDYVLALVSVITLPEFQIAPESVKVSLGELVRLDCYAVGYPVPTQRWTFNDRDLVVEEGLQELPNGSLVIEFVAERDIGIYTCVATNQAGQTFASAQVEISGRPVFTEPPENKTISIGSNITLPCRGTSELSFSVSWYESSSSGDLVRQLYIGSFESSPGTSMSTVVVENFEFTPDGTMLASCVDKTSIGWYLCRLENSEGVVTSEPVYLDVEYIPDNIELTVSPTPPVESSSASLLCEAEGNPLPQLSWIEPSKLELTGSLTTITENNRLTSTFNILSVDTPTHGGEWYCKACNYLGCRTKSLTLHIEGRPVITGVTSEDSENELIVSCVASGLPTPTVSYFSQDLQTRATNMAGHREEGGKLFIDLAFVRDSYVCRAENNYGFSTEVTITRPPVVTILNTEPSNDWIQISCSSEVSRVSLLPTVLHVEYQPVDGGEDAQWVSTTVALIPDVEDYLLVLKDVIQHDDIFDCSDSSSVVLTRTVRDVESEGQSMAILTRTVRQAEGQSLILLSAPVTATGYSYLYTFRVELLDLPAHTEYNIRASLSNALGRGPVSESSTEETLTSGPGEIRNIRVGVANLTITVTWDNPEPLNGPVEQIVIHVKLFTQSSNTTPLNERHVSAASSSLQAVFVVEQVGDYFIQLYASNDIAESTSDTYTVDFNVPYVTPFFIPDIVEVFVVNSSSLEVHWSNVTDSDEVYTLTSVFAPVTGYLIHVEHVDSDGVSTTTELDIPYRSSFSFVLTDLLEHEQYMIKMAATNVIGRGNYSNPLTATTLYSVFSDKALEDAVPALAISWRSLGIILVCIFSVLVILVVVLLLSLQLRLAKCKSVDLTPPQSSRGRSIEEEWAEVSRQVRPGWDTEEEDVGDVSVDSKDFGGIVMLQDDEKLANTNPSVDNMTNHSMEALPEGERYQYEHSGNNTTDKVEDGAGHGIYTPVDHNHTDERRRRRREWGGRGYREAYRLRSRSAPEVKNDYGDVDRMVDSEDDKGANRTNVEGFSNSSFMMY